LGSGLDAGDVGCGHGTSRVSRRQHSTQLSTPILRHPVSIPTAYPEREDDTCPPVIDEVWQIQVHRLNVRIRTEVEAAAASYGTT
jgi:hypothetical protein